MKGKILGSRYKILEYLAEGGFGRTYLAEDTQLPGKDICVVKQLHPSSQNPRFLEIARRLFKTEASVLHTLGHHPQIPELLAYFEEESKFYLVQQYIEGQTLAKELDEKPIWTEVETVELLQNVLNILQFIHSKGVIHRDLKPDNLIRRQSDRQLVLVDFGTVKQVLQGQQTNLGQLTVAVGTQGYMPTEQARGKPRPTSDIYALGMIGIQALTGILPINLDEDDEGEIIWQAATDVSPGLAKILTQMTRYHFKDRADSATEILQELAKLPTSNITKPQSITAVYPSPTQVLERNSGISVDHQTTAGRSLATSMVNNSGTDSHVSDIPNSSVATDYLSATAINNRISQVHPPVIPPKRGKTKAIAAALMVMTAIAGVGAYIVLRPLPESESRPQTIDSQSDESSDRESESLPANPTKRKPQGSGFRDDL